MTNANVTLRALEPEDLELVHGIENDATLWPWASAGQPLSRYTVRQYLQDQHADIYQDGELRLVIEADGQAVGLADLTSFCPHHLRAEVGIVVRSAHQRRGIATQALHLLADYAARHLHLRSLYAYASEENTAARALFLRAGYSVAASLPRWIEGRTTALLFLLPL